MRDEIDSYDENNIPRTPKENVNNYQDDEENDYDSQDRNHHSEYNKQNYFQANKKEHKKISKSINSAKPLKFKNNQDNEYFPSNNSMINKNNEKMKKIYDHPIQKKTLESIINDNSDINKERVGNREDYKNKNIQRKVENNDGGSTSENDKEYKSINRRTFNKSLSPTKKEINRTISPDNDYIKLEFQIKDMENQIKNMNNDYSLGRGITSSRSLGFITKNSNLNNISCRNPFIENFNNKSNSKLNNLEERKNGELKDTIFTNNDNQHEIKTTLNQENLYITDPINNNLLNTEKKFDSQQNSIKKELNTISYNSPNNLNNNIKLNNTNNKSENSEVVYGSKIINIENKLEKLETDIGEMKDNFNKLYDSILKLIEIANGKNINFTEPNNIQNQNFNKIPNMNQNYLNQNNLNNYNNLNENTQRLNTQGSKISANNPNLINYNQSDNNNYGVNTNSNNDVLNFILSECHKFKNEKFQNFNTNNNNPNFNTNNNNPNL